MIHFNWKKHAEVVDLSLVEFPPTDDQSLEFIVLMSPPMVSILKTINSIKSEIYHFNKFLSFLF